MKNLFLLAGAVSVIYFSTYAQTTYTYNGFFSVSDVFGWEDSGGNNPSNFTDNNQIFVFPAGISALVDNENWTVGGAGTEVWVGDATGSAELVVTSTGTFVLNSPAVLKVKDKATLTLQQTNVSSNLPSPTLVTAEAGSTIKWEQGGSSTIDIWPITYHNLTIGGTAAKRTTPSTITVVNGTLATTNTLKISNAATLTLAGEVSGSFNTFWENSSTSYLNITGSTTNSVNIVLPNDASTQRIGGVNFTKPATIKINRSSKEYLIGSTVRTTVISCNVLDLSGSIDTRIGGPVTFGASSKISGSPTLSLSILGNGAISGNLNFDQTNANTKALKYLFLNKSGQTLTLVNNLDIYGEVKVQAGTLASNGFLTLKSNATQKARIAALGTTGDITGNVTVETFAKGSTTGWTNLAVAGVSGQTMASGWGDDFPMTCPSGCPNGSTVGGSPFTSVTTYDEASDTYPGINNGSDPITPGIGYWVYLGNGAPSSPPGPTGDITIDVTGPIVKKNAGSWNITVNGNGWNLLGNPYPSPISFSALHSAAGGAIDANVYVYNPGLGDHAIYNASSGISNPPVNYSTVDASGINDNIPTGQGFYVEASSATTITWDETYKSASASANPLLKTANHITSSSQQSRAFYLHLTKDSTANSYTAIYFNPNTTTAYNSLYDAEQMDPSPAPPKIFAVVGGKEVKIKGIPYPNGNTPLDIQVRSAVSGTYQIALEYADNIPSGVCITLFDKFTNTTHNLLSSPYVFSFSDTTTVSRFVLNVSMNQLTNLTTNIVNTPNCHNENTGLITASMGSGNYTFVWKDANYQVLRTTMGVSKDTLKNIGEGYYFVEVTDGNCANATNNVQVVANVSTPVIDFTPVADTLPVNTTFTFVNNSQNLSNFTWYFDDGSEINVSNVTVAHTYANPGNYMVVLSGKNACGDTLDTYKEIVVTSVTGINPNGVPVSPQINISRDNKGYYLTASYTRDTKVNILITDILGRTLIKETVVLGNNKKFYLHKLQAQQIIVVRAEDGYNVINQKIYIEE